MNGNRIMAHFLRSFSELKTHIRITDLLQIAFFSMQIKFYNTNFLGVISRISNANFKITFILKVAGENSVFCFFYYCIFSLN